VAEDLVLASEDALARRITYEREQRSWSPGGLANLMTKAGCPIGQSAIWKIENGNPRRKITVDELLTFAKVFEVEVTNLLLPPELAARPDLLVLIEKRVEAELRVWKAEDELSDAQQNLNAFLKTHPDLKNESDRVIDERLRKTLPGYPRTRRLGSFRMTYKSGPARSTPPVTTSKPRKGK